jgi:hypothetical protein
VLPLPHQELCSLYSPDVSSNSAVATMHSAYTSQTLNHIVASCDMLTCTICISFGSPLSLQLGCSSCQSSSASPASSRAALPVPYQTSAVCSFSTVVIMHTAETPQDAHLHRLHQLRQPPQSAGGLQQLPIKQSFPCFIKRCIDCTFPDLSSDNSAVVTMHAAWTPQYAHLHHLHQLWQSPQSAGRLQQLPIQQCFPRFINSCIACTPPDLSSM